MAGLLDTEAYLGLLATDPALYRQVMRDNAPAGAVVGAHHAFIA
jgi:hypothetical protein